jgi:LemA protein
MFNPSVPIEESENIRGRQSPAGYTRKAKDGGKRNDTVRTEKINSTWYIAPESRRSAFPLLVAWRLRAGFYPDMSIGKILLFLVGAVIAIGIVVAVILTGMFNRLVTLQQATDASWAQVQNVYQRRADLVPNLVNTVKGAANFERTTLNEVTEARASVGRVQLPAGGAPTDPQKLEEFAQAQAQLGGALSRLLVVVERYPELRATEAFRDLQSQLEGTENRISVERGRFNEAVQAYNTAIKRFPAVMFAGMFGHAPRPYFASAPGAETAPVVDFDSGSKDQPNN